VELGPIEEVAFKKGGGFEYPIPGVLPACPISLKKACQWGEKALRILRRSAFQGRAGKVFDVDESAAKGVFFWNPFMKKGCPFFLGGAPFSFGLSPEELPPWGGFGRGRGSPFCRRFQGDVGFWWPEKRELLENPRWNYIPWGREGVLLGEGTMKGSDKSREAA